MADDPSIQDNGWGSYLPWLILVRCFRIATSVRMLLLGAGGAVANAAGWRILWNLLGGSQDPVISDLRDGIGPDTPWPEWPWQMWEGVYASNLLASPWTTIQYAVDAATATVMHYATPFTMMFDEESGFVGFTFGLLCLLWSLLVWSYIGSAMTRTAALRLCRDEIATWTDVSNFSIAKFPSYFAAPLFSGLGILLAALPVLIVGFVARLDIGLLLAGLLWPLVLLSGLFMMIIAVGFIFGWPFMWATVSTEGSDAFDALSRSYAYVYQRPLKYLFYAVVALLLGGLGFIVVGYFVEGVSYFAYWATDIGASHERVELMRAYTNQTGVIPDNPGGMAGAGLSLVSFWVSCVRLLGAGYVISYVWTAMTAIYLLLRRDIDATELDEIYLTDAEATYGLPSLAADEGGTAGVPGESDVE
ncbi:MAG: hypothetical protein DWQ31_02905 [Planctomycetota bacterium]|nr:MAG: hypothetical protein DWQ31_02905 [Planctomycetota bacterium]REJ88975.1 MAG: hypothetical protein DWQ35_19015 [Planctomycetota bacterium]REK31223.1 MAG: hypothetical protein DWQ42_00875 [Planctomycetota bacterium]REK43561.1 MAG: hypothetical protein DWQ46_10760 [Planctomycetota bacterium]